MSAPDYPGMGYSDAPAPTVLQPTFDDVAKVIDVFIDQRASGTFILYMHDFGGPIGMRIATAHPDRIAGLIFQNMAISEEGWNPERLKFYERIGGPETPDKLAEAEQFATVDRDAFVHQRGARRPDALNPDNWAIDAYAFSIAEKRLFMSRLFMNLATNFELYPEWNSYLKNRQPKTLVVWGRNDSLPAGERGISEAECANRRGALFRWRPLRARRVLRRDRRGDHRDVLAIDPIKPHHANVLDRGGSLLVERQKSTREGV